MEIFALPAISQVCGFPIHKFGCPNKFPEKLHFSYKKYFFGINFPKITYYVFVCDSENCMETLFGNFSCKIAFQFHEIPKNLSRLVLGDNLQRFTQK